VWRSLQCIDQQLTGEFAFQAPELVGIEDNDGIPTMQRDVLWPIAVCQAYQLAEARLCVLKAPRATGRLR